MSRKSERAVPVTELPSRFAAFGYMNYFRPYLRLNFSTRPLVSTSFCLPV